MLDGLITGELELAAASVAGEEDIAELRIRVGKPLVVMKVDGKRRTLGGYVVTREDVDGIIARATDLSPYSVSDEIKKGYIPFKRARIGVGGEGVNDGDKLLGVKNISYMVVRIPHQIRSAADKILPFVLNEAKSGVYRIENESLSSEYANTDEIKGKTKFAEFKGGDVRSTLVISPPGAGKTTVLRELARQISYFKNVTVIDERYEFAGAQGGGAALDVGYADVISGINKTVAYENCVRAMDPEVIVLDEIFRESEIDAVGDVVRCGIKVFASVHSDGVEGLARSKAFARLLDFFELAVTLAPVGVLREARRL